MVGTLKHVAYMDVSKNSIEMVDEQISGCENLQDLLLSNNALTQLPGNIGNNTHTHTQTHPGNVNITDMHTHTHSRTQTHTPTHRYTCLHKHMHTHTRKSTFMHSKTHAHTHTHTPLRITHRSRRPCVLSWP